MAGRKIIVKKEGTPAGNWMVTFSDMCTLLLTFFVLLFSMSTINVHQFKEAFKAAGRDELGLLNESADIEETGIVIDPIPEIIKRPEREALGLLARSSEMEEVGSGLPEGVEIVISDSPEGEIEIIIAERILFDPGSMDLTRGAREFLDRVREYLRVVLAYTTRGITIEGHTDDTGPEEEGYIISARRAYGVLNYILGGTTADGRGAALLPAERFTIIGYGAGRPAVPNTTDSNRAKNRRVRILIGPKEESIFELRQE